jgi:hypothetical protein
MTDEEEKTAIIIRECVGEFQVWCGQWYGWYPIQKVYEEDHPVVVYNSVKLAESQAERLRKKPWRGRLYSFFLPDSPFVKVAS